MSTQCLDVCPRFAMCMCARMCHCCCLYVVSAVCLVVFLSVCLCLLTHLLGSEHLQMQNLSSFHRKMLMHPPSLRTKRDWSGKHAQKCSKDRCTGERYAQYEWTMVQHGEHESMTEQLQKYVKSQAQHLHVQQMQGGQFCHNDAEFGEAY
jgi:hypothetical protein